VSAKVSQPEGVPVSVAQQRNGEKRRALISEAPSQVGALWARVWCEALRQEGRSVDGGWPGTLSESRSRVRSHLDGELSKRGLQPLDHLELERATAATYERAKYDWLALVNSRRASRRRTSADDANET
jgi:hypothetical protein